jgi:hypothetical protein
MSSIYLGDRRVTGSEARDSTSLRHVCDAPIWNILRGPVCEQNSAWREIKLNYVCRHYIPNYFPLNWYLNNWKLKRTFCNWTLLCAEVKFHLRDLFKRQTSHWDVDSVRTWEVGRNENDENKHLTGDFEWFTLHEITVRWKNLEDRIIWTCCALCGVGMCQDSEFLRKECLLQSMWETGLEIIK